MVNTQKLKSSALIALGGLLISVVPLMADNLIEVIQVGAPFDWKTPVIMLITATSTWVVATIRNYLKNK